MTTRAEAMNSNALVHIRDPRYGILSYLVPKHEAVNMGQALVNIGTAPIPKPPATRN